MGNNNFFYSYYLYSEEEAFQSEVEVLLASDKDVFFIVFCPSPTRKDSVSPTWLKPTGHFYK